MNFDTNPYYSPNECGLEIFEQIDTAGSYEFCMFVIWKKLDDDSLWYDVDSGCSCPVPFDNHRHNLTKISKDTWYNFEQSLKNHPDIKMSDYITILQKVKSYIRDSKIDYILE